MKFGINVKFSCYFYYKISLAPKLRYLLGYMFCEETYVGETIRKCKIRWDEHNNVNNNSCKTFRQIRLNMSLVGMYRSSRPEVFLGKRVLKICSKFTGEHPC